ncbi:DUF6876 family protein [Pedobacter sp. MC2016-24]|uniref:DUF6876 family protein n=1 Tax=Pedobacter sp. MC2016-24 TaxID=2780090 RepID=UPI00187E6DA5|nr:DUF6876 family protein [Pedobacter sp. MC2016-24]MBE9599879.1 hypothetical protein [Pedobacter sp. MC2016-24]
MENHKNLNDQLNQFIGTVNYYKHPLGFHYTDGVQYVASKYGTYWLLVDIGVHIRRSPKLMQNYGFICWTLKRNSPQEDSFTLTAEDGNYNLLFKISIPYSDFKADQLSLWFEGGVLLLPSEH